MKLTAFLIGLILLLGGALTQPTSELAAQNVLAQEQLKIDGTKNVWMLTYFRQRYPNKIRSARITTTTPTGTRGYFNWSRRSRTGTSPAMRNSTGV